MSVWLPIAVFLAAVMPFCVFFAHKEGWKQGRVSLIEKLDLKRDYTPYAAFNEIKPGDRVQWVKNHLGQTEWWTVKSRTDKSLYLVDLNCGSMNVEVPASLVLLHRPVSWFSEYPRYDVKEAAKATGLLP